MKTLEMIHRQMRELEEERRENTRKMREIWDKTRLIQARTVKDIALETDGKGNRVYSNESLRRAELTIRLSENEEWQILMRQLRPLREKDNELIFELNRLSDRKDMELKSSCQEE